MKKKESRTKAKAKKVAIRDLKPRKAAGVKGGVGSIIDPKGSLQGTTCWIEGNPMVRRG